MDQDRVEGSTKTVMGRVKRFFGGLAGDSKLKAEGKLDQAEGRVQNTLGGIKDTFREDDPTGRA
jgi:uncharacterized protein YjbJ (UPF0337 family)